MLHPFHLLVTISSLLQIPLPHLLQSANFFKKKEQESQIKNIVYDKGPLAKGITACDLGGRSTVAPASEAKRNTVGF